jgi:hypothetical protein
VEGPGLFSTRETPFSGRQILIKKKSKKEKEKRRRKKESKKEKKKKAEKGKARSRSLKGDYSKSCKDPKGISTGE